VLTVGLFSASVLAYALFSRLLDRWSVTAQIVVLAAGIGLGVAARGSGETAFDTELLRVAGELALILTLVVDAARIDLPALRRTEGLPIRLLGLGLPLTVVLGTIVAVVVLPGFTILDAIIVSALLAPTDAALGATVVNSARVPRRIRQALNVESGLNDGLVTPIVLVAASAAAAAGDPTDAWIRHAVAEVAFGAFAGIVVGALAGIALRVAVARRWTREGSHWMAAPAIAFLAWALAHGLGGNIFVAAFAAGIATTAAYGHLPETFLDAAEVGGDLVGLIVFFLFGALLVNIAGGVSVPVVIYALLSLTVVRLLPVALSLAGTRLRWPTVAFVGWFGPRGLASIVLTLVALGDSGGTPQFDATVISVVAVTVALSVVAHGLSAGPAVARYGNFVSTLPEDATERARSEALRTRGGVDRRSFDEPQT